MKTLADLKVGDEVWIKTEVTSVSYDGFFPIKTQSGLQFNLDGEQKVFESRRIQRLFVKNPFEKKAESKLMLVSTGTSDWIEKQIIIDSITNRVFVMSEWEFYKEIEPKETLTALAIAEISLEQIAEKFGVDVEQIRIKS